MSKEFDFSQEPKFENCKSFEEYASALILYKTGREIIFLTKELKYFQKLNPRSRQTEIVQGFLNSALELANNQGKHHIENEEGDFEFKEESVGKENDFDEGVA